MYYLNEYFLKQDLSKRNNAALKCQTGTRVIFAPFCKMSRDKMWYVPPFHSSLILDVSSITI